MNLYQIIVGSYGTERDEAIQLVEYDADKQVFRKKAYIDGVSSPSFLAFEPNKQILYAVSEEDIGEIICYKMDINIRECIRTETGGSGPCYVHVDSDTDFLFITNYGSGNITVHPLDDAGMVSQLSENISLGDESNISHPHMVYPLGRNDLYFVTDLGQDLLFVFQLDRVDQKLTKKNIFHFKKGTGPRHIAMNISSNIIYVANEFSSTVSVYRYVHQTNKLQFLQDILTVPNLEQKEGNFCADIHISPFGEFLYVSNRGRNTIVSYKILESGLLQRWSEASTVGKWPRNFSVSADGKYLFIANEHSDSINVIQVNNDGNLTTLPVHYSMTSPTCILMHEKRI
ncbi:lactonase family protein [Gracilibacillus kekensis]|uniref:6-phosphogluconolactonase n=1 Tax=Gracilibacillus kekensis TaxID=1027249 RepID=A0A1M7QTH9_9BACI|nr:lactonase family protein [Gracilibacillus kekensis]SHN34753.1 6-phosphogluconolactonase [Gracilibacillus kekensis]